MQGDEFLTVSQLVARVKRLIESDRLLSGVWVVGELSGVKHHASGHWYFTLKDDAQLRAVMFRREAARLMFVPEDGQAVMAYGRVGVYERDGQTQLYVQHLEPVGAGQQFLALEALKQRLQAEGLFQRPKRPLPVLPRAIGVVTSRSGAALHDVRTVAQRRFPDLPLLVAAVTVQGDNAPAEIVRALKRVGNEPGIDVVILARGGGSREDLMVFNHEAVVRAVAACAVPVISAIGHEVDVTLSDLAADVRAPTPSAAAELAVPERTQLEARVRELGQRLQQRLRLRIAEGRRRLEGWSAHGVLRSPSGFLSERRFALARQEDRLRASLNARLVTRRRALDRGRALLSGLNPSAVLERGFTMVTGENGRPLAYAQVVPHATVHIHWREGAWVAETLSPETCPPVSDRSTGATSASGQDRRGAGD